MVQIAVVKRYMNVFVIEQSTTWVSACKSFRRVYLSQKIHLANSVYSIQSRVPSMIYNYLYNIPQ